MLKPKITIGAKHSPNQDRYRMTLIEVESFKHRQLSHSLLQNRLCGVFRGAVGKGYLKLNTAVKSLQNKAFPRAVKLRWCSYPMKKSEVQKRLQVAEVRRSKKAAEIWL